MQTKAMLLRAAAIPAALLLAAVPGTAMAGHLFTADLTSLNDSGVTGTAQLELSDDRRMLTVSVFATGLEPNMNHPGHIHGRFTPSGQPMNSFTPTLAQDTDGDGFIELAEGAATYGPIIIPFTELTDPGPEAPLGTLFYTSTFNLLDSSTYANDFSRDDLLPLQHREIVLHGMTVRPGVGAGTPGEVDGTNGYLAVLPVASGEIRPMAHNNMGAIPEPSTWAMMLIGFGAVGFGMRRRKSKGGTQRVRISYT